MDLPVTAKGVALPTPQRLDTALVGSSASAAGGMVYTASAPSRPACAMMGTSGKGVDAVVDVAEDQVAVSEHLRGP